jgi:hypothetical protein
MKHRAPEIALIHEFASSKEVSSLKNLARGRMKSTPYQVGDKEEEYSKLRTSKVMYVNERRSSVAKDMSDKIQLATRYSLYHEKYASENFQIMNYGIGGTISGHLDSAGTVLNYMCYYRSNAGSKDVRHFTLVCGAQFANHVSSRGFRQARVYIFIV